ncbi:MAG: hypothetical protein Q8O53_01910, partial [Candidatus Moranbacteria bacterium]|nr:hypothetical protein [Candidatus Moranbacteria bacterium]
TEAIAAMKERVKSQAASDIPTDPEILEQGKFEDAMRESLRNFRELPNGEDIVKKIEDLLIEESREFHETFPEKVREQNFRLSSKVDLQKLFSEEFLAIIEEKIVKKLLEQKKISTEDEGKKLFWAIEWNLRQGDITR